MTFLALIQHCTGIFLVFCKTLRHTFARYNPDGDGKHEYFILFYDIFLIFKSFTFNSQCVFAFFTLILCFWTETERTGYLISEL